MKEIKSIVDFQEIIKSDKPILLDFYAEWCGPCQRLMPIVETIAEKHESDLIVAKINVDTNPELSQKFSVRSIPALFLIQNGEVKERINGLQTESALDSLVHKYSSITSH